MVIPLRVALVSMHTSPLAAPGSGDAGGMNVYVSALADALAERGIDVEILTRRAQAAQPATARTKGGVLVRFLDAGAPTLPKEELSSVTAEFGAKIGELDSFDVFHSHYWLSGEAVAPLARRTRTPHVLSFHTVAALKNEAIASGQLRESTGRIGAERALAGEAQAIVASTEHEARGISRLYAVPSARIHIIPPGVDTRVFHPNSRPKRHDAELLVVGRVQPLKGQELAIRALAAVRTATARLTLVGGGSGPDGAGDYQQSLRSLARELSVADRVAFVGPLSRDDVAARMREAALILMPSSSETYGLVALEAAASGTPVLAARTTGLQESVVDGVTGRFVKTGDPTDWATAIDRLLADNRAFMELGDSGAAYAVGHDWSITAQKTAALYERVLAAQRGER